MERLKRDAERVATMFDEREKKGTVADRRGAEEGAEAERENVGNVPHGRDLQDTLGGQEPEPRRVDKSTAGPAGRKARDE